jgi:hypothetical protein
VDVPGKKVRPEGGVHVGDYLAEGLINRLDHEIVDQGERLLRQPRIKEKTIRKETDLFGGFKQWIKCPRKKAVRIPIQLLFWLVPKNPGCLLENNKEFFY